MSDEEVRHPNEKTDYCVVCGRGKRVFPKADPEKPWDVPRYCGPGCAMADEEGMAK